MSKNSLIFGAKLILEYLNSETSITKIWLLKNLSKNLQEIEELARKRKIPVHKMDRKELERAFQHHENAQNIRSAVAEVAPIKIFEEDYIYQQTEPKSYVFAVNIEDPHNLGAIIRSIHAFGFEGVIVSNRNTATISDTVIRASAGSIFKTKVIRVGNVNTCLKKMKDNGFWVYGTDVSSGESEELSKVKFDQKSVILLGNEGKGLAPNIKKNCDFLVHIPCKFNSLNVSVATGIILSSVYHQQTLNK